MSVSHPATSEALLRKTVYEKLLSDLKSGKLEPGSLVRIKNLAEEIGISRTPLRDALLQLQVEGFITMLPQRGVIINELTDEEKAHIYEVCGCLDYQVMLSVFPLITREHITRMEALNAKIKSIPDGGDRAEFNDYNFDFHSIYLDLCPNPILRQLLNTYRNRLFHFANRDWGEGFYTLNYTEHEVLIDLIKTGKAQEAAEYLRDVHWSLNWEE